MATDTDGGRLNQEARAVATDYLRQGWPGAPPTRREILREIRQLARQLQTLREPREMVAVSERLLELADRL